MKINYIVNRKHIKMKDYMISYSMIFPFFILLIFFSIIPIVNTVYLSFRDASMLNNGKFIGLKNYAELLTNSEFYLFLTNSLLFIVFSVPIGVLIAFLFATLLAKPTRLSTISETIFFLPLLLSMSAASVMLQYLFSNTGVVNYFISLFGIPSISWTSSPLTARALIIILEIWKGCELYIFIFIAALRAIPKDFYESAMIDGASILKQFTKITFPLMRTQILFCTIMSCIWQLQIFDSVYTTTKGDPMQTTKSMVFAIYEEIFTKNRIGRGTSMAILFFFVILLFTWIQLKIKNTCETYEY